MPAEIPLLIRPAEHRDMPALLEMVRGLAVHHGDEATVTQDILARDVLGPQPWLTVLVAEREGRLIGYVALFRLAQLQFGRRGMDMHHLFVASGHRGQGVGRALIDAALAEAEGHGCTYVMVGTHPGNVAAGEVYLAAGFEAAPPPGPRFGIRLPRQDQSLGAKLDASARAQRSR